VRVVSLGVHILDILGAPVDPGANPDERHVLESVRLTAAGTAAGTSVDLAKLGAQVIAMGAVGDDLLGELVLQLLSGHGVDTSHVVRKPGLETSATILPIASDGERWSTFHSPGASRHLALDDVAMEEVLDADLLHIGGPDVMGAFSEGPLLEVLRAATANGVPTTMDVLSSTDTRTLARLTPALELVDYFFPNIGQIRTMTGIDDPLSGAEALRAIGVKCVVATLGPDGSLIVAEGEHVRIPAFESPVVDTTGCGDAYTAGFIIGTLKGWDLRSRGLLGAACAGLVAGGLGSDAGIESLDQTLAFLAEQTGERLPVGVGGRNVS
jgi:sugar/nucleoside kinase (ribokinase family)